MNIQEPVSPVGMAPLPIHNFTYYDLTTDYIIEYIKNHFQKYNFIYTNLNPTRHHYQFIKNDNIIECILYKSKHDVRESIVTFNCLNSNFNMKFLDIIKEFRKLHIYDPSLNDASQDINQQKIKMGHPLVFDVNFSGHNLEDAKLDVPFQIFDGLNMDIIDLVCKYY